MNRKINFYDYYFVNFWFYVKMSNYFIPVLDIPLTGAQAWQEKKTHPHRLKVCKFPMIKPSQGRITMQSMKATGLFYQITHMC